MHRVRVLFCFFVLALTLTLMAPVFGAPDDTVYVVPLEAEVERGLQSFIDRAITEAEENNADAILFELNTPGGFVNAADGIARLLDETSLETIAYINRDALSAGAFLALHADAIYMHPNGRIGAAQVIDQTGNAAGDKANSAWLASMKSAAESSGRDPLYALAMADPSIDLPEYRAGEGELLTLSAEEALAVDYSEGTASSIQEVLEVEGYEGAQLVTVNETFTEKLARFITNPVVVPILLSVAGLGLVLELYSPGFGIPGIMGLSALLLFFYGHLVAGLAGYESILLLILGVSLIVAEFFLPGGILGIAGLAAVLGSVLLAGGDLQSMALAVLIAIIAALTGAVIFMKFFGKRLRLFNRIILMDSTNTESGYVSNVRRSDLIGKTAVTLTALRPSGTVAIDEERYDAVSEGGYIDRGKEVRIVKTEGSWIVVRELKKSEEE